MKYKITEANPYHRESEVWRSEEIIEVKPPEPFSWTNVLESMLIDERIKVDVKYERTLSSRISREVRLKHPDRVYKTDRKTLDGFMIIKREK